MRKEELRIGNLNLYYPRHPHLPEGIGWRENNVDWQDLKNITEDEKKYNKHHQPIELNSSWLERMGFIYENPSYEIGYYANYGGVRVLGLLKADNGFFTGIKEHPDGKASLGIMLKYVHQLQNLYYYLTNGEEIEIKQLEKV